MAGSIFLTPLSGAGVGVLIGGVVPSGTLGPEGVAKLQAALAAQEQGRETAGIRVFRPGARHIRRAGHLRKLCDRDKIAPVASRGMVSFLRDIPFFF